MEPSSAPDSNDDPQAQDFLFPTSNQQDAEPANSSTTLLNTGSDYSLLFGSLDSVWDQLLQGSSEVFPPPDCSLPDTQLLDSTWADSWYTPLDSFPTTWDTTLDTTLDESTEQLIQQLLMNTASTASASNDTLATDTSGWASQASQPSWLFELYSQNHPCGNSVPPSNLPSTSSDAGLSLLPSQETQTSQQTPDPFGLNALLAPPDSFPCFPTQPPLPTSDQVLDHQVGLSRTDTVGHTAPVNSPTPTEGPVPPTVDASITPTGQGGAQPLEKAVTQTLTSSKPSRSRKPRARRAAEQGNGSSTRGQTSLASHAGPSSSRPKVLPSSSSVSSIPLDISVKPLDSTAEALPDVAPATQITFGVGKRRKTEKVRTVDSSVFEKKEAPQWSDPTPEVFEMTAQEYFASLIVRERERARRNEVLKGMVLVRLRECTTRKTKTWSIAKPEDERLGKYFILSGPFKGQSRTIRKKQDIRPYTNAEMDLIHSVNEAIYILNDNVDYPGSELASASKSPSSSSTTTTTATSS